MTKQHTTRGELTPSLALDSQTLTTLLATDCESLRTLWDSVPHSLTVKTEHYGKSADLPDSDDGWTARHDDDDAAAIDETWTHDYREEWTDDTVTVVCVVTLKTGCAEYVGPQHVGMAVGEPTEYRQLKTLARQDAESAARNYRTACRASVAVLGDDKHVGSAGWLDSESYALLRAGVMRWTHGNARTAGKSSARQYVRAGVTANGMPLDVHTIDDATQNGALIIQRWMTRGLPESIESLVADLDDENARRVVIGTAARDGLRMTTQHKRPTSLATATSAWSVGSHVNTDDGPVRTDDARRVNVRSGSASYVHNGADGLRTDALLARLTARHADGSLVAPTLLRIFLHDGNMDDVARSLGRTRADGRGSASAIAAVKRDARAEWDALHDGTTADDAAEWVDALTSVR